MARQNRSVSIPEDVSEQIDRAADEAGMTPSAWLVEAARDRLALEQGLAAIDEWFTENGGPPTDEEEAWVDSVFEHAQAIDNEELAS